ncbi:MAG: hypothetical protein ACE5GX_05545 [Thermoanaerobaculia bacterium]
MNYRPLVLTTFSLIALLALPAFGYTVVLKDGSQIIAQQAPTIQGDRAIIVLQSGTRTAIAASEIDVERTRDANQHELGTAMVLEGGEFTNKPVETVPEKRESLTDLARRRRQATAVNRAPVSRSAPDVGATRGADDLSNFQRTPYRNLDVLEAIQGAFKSQGVESAKVYQGTSSDRLLIEVETNSEAAVFRSIKVAAGALTHVRSNISAEVQAFELLLATSNQSPAGQFVMTTEDAAALSSGALEIPTYFIDKVRF